MNRELFGVFGDFETFTSYRSPDEFTEIVETEQGTVGIRDPDLGTEGWSSIHRSADGACLIQGELYPPEHIEKPSAEWLLEAFLDEGRAAFSRLNGSYLLFLGTGEEAMVVTDPIRSRECYYTDDGIVVFGTDAAKVGSVISSPRIRREAVLEYLHLGVMLGEKTSLESLDRLLMDSMLTPSGTVSLRRFVYDEKEFDYPAELATRLGRAFERRAGLPGRKGLLLSAGYDSRAILANIPAIQECYTVGARDTQEVVGAHRLANQYDTPHTTFEPDREYLFPNADKVRYAQGTKESLHIHHAGFTDEIEADVLYHGLLCDTFFRGHFTAEKHIDLFDKRIPLGGPDPDPNPVGHLLDKFGYDRTASVALAEHTGLDERPHPVVRNAVKTELECAQERADSVQNAINACGIGNQPSMPFHTQIVDNYLGSFLPADIELINWHLETPPEWRTTRTFLQSCKRLDPEMTRYPPADRPHESHLRNELERFIRRQIPMLESFEPPWPDREAMFTHYGFDHRLLPEFPHLHEPLPARHKLRIHDLLEWLQQTSPAAAQSFRDLLSPR